MKEIYSATYLNKDMFKNINIKKTLLIVIVIAIIVFIIWYLRKPKKIKESAFAGDFMSKQVVPTGDTKEIPSFFNLRSKIDVEGKKKVFPFEIEKMTEGVIELPNRRSLIDKDAKYKFIDVKPGDKVKIVALINLSYTVDHFAFNDDFLVTEKDNLLAYTQALEHFRMA